MALLQQCLTLSHHALESFIIDQTESDRAHLLNQLGTHPNIKTISDKVNALWTTMCTQTYLTADRSLVQAMTDKQVRSLRKLTVLSALAQKNSVSVEELVRQLDLKRVDVYRLLTEMSGENLITVRIDEENSLVHILASKRRQNPSLGRSQLVAECEHRLHRILADNKKLMEFLSRNSVVK